MDLAEWDAADLVVVGYGAAGAACAITAADLGANVILLEKQPAEWHTPSTRASGGAVTAVTDAESAFAYFDRCAAGMIPSEVSRAWLERATDVIAWLEGIIGIPMARIDGAEHPEWEGADAVSAFGSKEAFPWGDRSIQVLIAMTPEERTTSPPRPGGGQSLFAALEAAVQRRKRVQVRYEHRATRLVQAQDKRITGVEADHPNGRTQIESRCGVVLTCGGYEFDDAMKLSYLRASPMYFYGSPVNTGDGVRMAQAVGADLRNMNAMIGRAIIHVDNDGRSHNYQVWVSLGNAGYVLADKYGRRFANEHMQAMARHDFYHELITYDSARAEYPRIPCYWFFDQRRVSAAPIPGGTGAAGPYSYDWSADNESEIARGWIVRGEDVEDVARRVGISDPAQAARTIRAYNDACASKSDEFGRPADSLIPLDCPPYYCMHLWPGGPNTSGGPMRNENAQVIDVFGDPIPGLYEAGELGQAIGALYPANGANISDALCFGRIAAEHALASQSER